MEFRCTWLSVIGNLKWTQRDSNCAQPSGGSQSRPSQYPLNKNSLAAVFSGPREIRTLDLLNAIETRSQLRYGPLFTQFLLFPMALPIPRGGDYVRYGPLFTQFLLFPMALPIPPWRGLRALWTLVYSVSFVSHGAPNSPVEGTTCAMGPCFVFSERQLAFSRMDLEGFEPSTSSVRLKRAPNCATGPYSIQISRLNILPA